MSTQRVERFYVHCDEGETCDAGDDVGPVASMADVLSRARRAGWRCDDSGDWCEEHRAAGEGPP